MISVEQVNGDVIYKESPWLTQDELMVIVRTHQKPPRS